MPTGLHTMRMIGSWETEGTNLAN